MTFMRWEAGTHPPNAVDIFNLDSTPRRKFSDFFANGRQEISWDLRIYLESSLLRVTHSSICGKKLGALRAKSSGDEDFIFGGIDNFLELKYIFSGLRKAGIEECRSTILGA